MSYNAPLPHILLHLLTQWRVTSPNVMFLSEKHGNGISTKISGYSSIFLSFEGGGM